MRDWRRDGECSIIKRMIIRVIFDRVFMLDIIGFFSYIEVN